MSTKKKKVQVAPRRRHTEKTNPRKNEVTESNLKGTMYLLVIMSVVFGLLLASCTKQNTTPPPNHGECRINGLPLAWVDVNNPNNTAQSPIPIALGGRNITITFSDPSETVSSISVTAYVAGTNLGNKLPEAYWKLSSFILPSVITACDWKITVRTNKNNEYYGAFRVP
jgi:hypothetical protein